MIGAATALTSDADQDLNQMIADLVAQRDAVKQHDVALSEQLKATEKQSEALSEQQRQKKLLKKKPK